MGCPEDDLTESSSKPKGLSQHQADQNISRNNPGYIDLYCSGRFVVNGYRVCPASEGSSAACTPTWHAACKSVARAPTSMRVIIAVPLMRVIKSYTLSYCKFWRSKSLHACSLMLDLRKILICFSESTELSSNEIF